MKKISSVAELTNILANAKAGGQFVTIYGESDVKLNKFPTDGSERIHIKADFTPRNRFSVTYNFKADYEKAMAKALGVDSYTAHDANRIHLIKNVMMQYVSTGTICLIYMPVNYHFEGTFLGGKEMSAEDTTYMNRYKSKAKSNSPLPYRTLNVKNVSKIAIGKEMYEVSISATQAAPAA